MDSASNSAAGEHLSRLECLREHLAKAAEQDEQAGNLPASNLNSENSEFEELQSCNAFSQNIDAADLFEDLMEENHNRLHVHESHVLQGSADVLCESCHHDWLILLFMAVPFPFPHRRMRKIGGKLLAGRDRDCLLIGGKVSPQPLLKVTVTRTYLLLEDQQGRGRQAQVARKEARTKLSRHQKHRIRLHLAMVLVLILATSARRKRKVLFV
ncbi:uncharacterized protein LOC113211897 [Frankliniella occidentalis]|uniref:Uncharacterized protein LOC113211897 n=1 Tax=Frankliniella occidentalis TaxID=133901 RepID=A0A9C6X2H0_FRAOC|nr:uncharacterized protein LOC113211897 [Frankliniella occidentalis]